ncbi:MAG: 2-oxoglutarate oxidoreductase, partial [Candidatus Caldatribacteriota bacterium]|nr:2-oxoglutarate oxidoreductase [Candidatus Caldatribacteriota bacterium]
IIKAKKAIKKAFQVQLDGKGFSLVEILSTCPTNWGLSPVESSKWLEDNMIPYFPLGEFKTPEEVI